MNILQFVCIKGKVYMNYIVPIVSFISILSGVLNYILNPGIIYSMNKSDKYKYCYECKMVYPEVSRKIVHCYDCEICVQGYDHHCGVIGKCIGKYNMIIFVSLAFCGMGFIMCLFLTFINLLVS